MGRKPDYRVGLLNKTTDDKGTIGAAWKNPDGSIAVTINTFVAIPLGGPHLLITLFPNKDLET